MSSAIQKQKIKKIFTLVLIFILICWNVFLYVVGVDKVVGVISVNNIYWSLFVIATVSGTSFLTSASFYSVFLSYSTAIAVNPLILAAVGGIGMSIGDSLFFFLARKSTKVMDWDKHPVYHKFYNKIEKLPKSVVYLFTLFYATFIPLPNDILMITLGLLKFRYRTLIPIIIFGNFILLLLVANGVRYMFV